jgi:hypothetical protein
MINIEHQQKTESQTINSVWLSVINQQQTNKQSINNNQQ